ncbi:unnamed protein product [Parnassius apollo]|uniref:(apollo) hypothetical protein n=1 Tax=Parnassius apollo TaxID=110799 RepID=A0A8S3XT18_PARAO|nr:unnamed protein product [Parnassius apollo]
MEFQVKEVILAPDRRGRKKISDKSTWKREIEKSKRFFLRKDKNNKIGIKEEPNYVSEVVNYGNVCKRGKSYENIKPTLMNIGVPVKTEKLNDVRKLLIKHFEEDWITIENLQYYKFLQEEENESNLIETDSEETLMEDEIDIRVLLKLLIT